MKMKKKIRLLIIFFIFIFVGCDSQKILFIKATKAWNNQQYEKAVDLFSKIIYKNKHSKYAIISQYYLGNIDQFNFKRYENAVINYQKAIVNAREKGKYAYLSQKNIAEIYKKQFKAYQQAIYEFKQLFNYPESKVNIEEILKNIYECYYKAKLYDEGISDFKDFLKKLPLNNKQKAETRILLSHLYQLNNQWEKAVQTLKKVLEYKPYTNRVKLDIANIYRAHNKKKEAKRIYSELLKAGYKKQLISDLINKIK